MLSTKTTTTNQSTILQAPHAFLQRQCACGNSRGPSGECAECRKKRLLDSPLQTKLRINQPGDRFEREADRMADVVMRMPAPTLQRQVQDEEEEEEEVLQTKPLVQQQVNGDAGGGSTAPAIVHDVLRSPGQSLNPASRGFMESRFDHDFGQVRVHTDARAAESARTVNARAYTVGRDVVFGSGQYAPDTGAGQRLLAHELTHVIQQNSAGSRSGVRSAGATAFGNGVSSHPPAVQRESPDEAFLRPPSAEESSAMMAEMACDFRTLCSLRRRKPEIVTQEQIERATKSCFPNKPGYLPCLFTGFAIDPLSPGVLAPPAQSPGVRPGPTPAPVPSSSSGLSDMLKFKFSAGPVDFNVDLPKSLNVKLPIPISAAYALEISTSAETSGAFSLSVKLDNKPHFSLTLKTGVDVSKETASAGVIFTTKRTVCRALPKESIKKEMQSAGKKIETAVTELQGKGSELSGMDRTTKLIDIASGIGDLYGAIEKTEAACTQVPLLEFGIKGETFIGERATDPIERSKQPANFIGPSLKFYIPGT